MDDPFKELRKAVNVRIRVSLKIAADKFNTLTDRFTPVWTGALQQSKRVEMENDTTVSVVMGNSDTAAYGWRQNTQALRHRGNFQSGLLDLTALHRDAMTIPGKGKRRVGVRNTGGGDKALYSRAYRLAVALGQLTKLDAPQVYERGAADPPIVAEIVEDFANSLGPL